MINKALTLLVTLLVLLSGCMSERLISPIELFDYPDAKIIRTYTKDGKTHEFKNESSTAVLHGKIIIGKNDDGQLVNILLSQLSALIVLKEDKNTIMNLVLLGITLVATLIYTFD